MGGVSIDHQKWVVYDIAIPGYTHITDKQQLTPALVGWSEVEYCKFQGRFDHDLTALTGHGE